MAKFLDETGLRHYTGLIQQRIDGKMDAADLAGKYDLANAKSLADATDLNDVTAPGIYMTDTADVAAGLANTPSSIAQYTLTVERLYNDDAIVMQTARLSSNGTTYTRRLYNGSWSEWRMSLTDYNTPDRVTAQGKSGSWTYLKFDSGFAVCHYAPSSPLTTAITSAWGGLYTSATIERSTPFALTSMSVTGSLVGYFYMVNAYAQDSNTIMYRLVSGASVSSVSASVRITATGFWK